jgi:SAM-dependent methyltransferase
MMEEPLGESAPLAWQQAPRLCCRDPRSHESCEAYHRVWQYLRLFDLIGSMESDAAFFQRQFRGMARSMRFPRVLVSATADYWMLAQLAAAYAAERAPLDVTIADRCGTPLMLNRWYGSRLGLEVRTREADLLTFDDEPYDVICTHSFLGRFDVEDRSVLLQRWHTLLRAGGKIVTSQRIRPGSTRTLNGFSASEVEALAQRVGRAAAERHQFNGPEPDGLVAVVRDYAASKKSHVIRDPERLLESMRQAGFGIEVAVQAVGETRRASSPEASGSFRLQIVAEK